MTKTITFIRHSEKKGGTVSKSHDVPLKETGMEMAAEIPKSIPDASVIIVSPALRTLQTAAPLAMKCTQSKVLLSNGLRDSLLPLPNDKERAIYCKIAGVDFEAWENDVEAQIEKENENAKILEGE